MAVTDESQAAPALDPKRAAEVFYDGACPVCRREIAFYQERLDTDAAWRDVSCEAPEGLDEGLDRETLLARFHVRRADGQIASGPAAFFAIWRGSARWGWLARALDRQPILAIGEAVYALFLWARPLWRPKSGG